MLTGIELSYSEPDSALCILRGFINLILTQSYEVKSGYYPNYMDEKLKHRQAYLFVQRLTEESHLLEEAGIEPKQSELRKGNQHNEGPQKFPGNSPCVYVCVYMCVMVPQLCNGNNDREATAHLFNLRGGHLHLCSFIQNKCVKQCLL